MTRTNANTGDRSDSQTRAFEEDDARELRDVFRRLRERFSVWPQYGPGDELDLVRFAFYEGCDPNEPALAAAAPLSVLQELVLGASRSISGRSGRTEWDSAPFRFCLAGSGGEWDFAITHELFPTPICRRDLLLGTWTREAYDEPTAQAEVAVDALWYIPLVLRWRREKGIDSDMPPGTSGEVRTAMLRRGISLSF